MYPARFLFFVTLVSLFTIGSLSAQDRPESQVVQLPVIGDSGFQLAPSRANFLGAFDITFNSGSGLAGNTAAEAAFDRAINQWEAFIADPITLEIDVDFTTLGAGQAAAATPVTLLAPYNNVRNQIVIDSATEADDAINLALPTGSQAMFNLPPGFTLSGSLEATKANLKALGFTGLDANFGSSDGMITFNSGLLYDFDNSDGVTPGSIDFESVAAHEIGHILGFISAVDEVDAFVAAGLTTAISPTTFDLYRFEDGSINDPSTAAQFTTATRSLIAGSTDVFDQVLAGPGLTELPLSTGTLTGNGQQASHYEDSLNLGALDPTLGPAQIVTVNTIDARVLDLIGYDITIATVGVPEPGMVSLMFLLAGPVMLCRRRAS